MGKKQNREWYNAKLSELTVNMFNEGIHLERAKVMSEIVLKHNPKHIFEFASGGSVLAQTILEKNQDINYVWSDWSEVAVEHAKDKLKNTSAWVGDCNIEALYKFLNWSCFDTVLCCSMEHLEKDVEILKELPKGTSVVLSIPCTDAPSHIRVLKSEEQIRERYGEILAIEGFTKVECFLIVDSYVR